MKFTTEQISKIENATWFYDIEQVLAEVLGVETYQIPSLEKEPYLEELVDNKTFDGIETELPYDEVARTINKIYGNLCYLSHYGQEGKGDKTTAEYETLWANALKKIEAKSATDNDYWAIGESSLEKFTPFEDKDEMMAFVHSAYEKAIELDTEVSSLTVMANRLCSEYYTNDELLDKAGERALSLAETFRDYIQICYNDNEERVFSQEIIGQAIDKVVELKEQAEDGDLENLILLLADDEEFDNIKKLDPNWTPPPPLESIEIKIKGRIPEYYYGSINDEYVEVFEKALEHANENMDTMQKLLEALLKTTLENRKEAMEVFKVDMDMEAVKENCPKLIELLKQIEDDEMDNYDLYREILDEPYEPRVIFVEDDATIWIEKEYEEFLPEQKLSDFLGEQECLDLSEVDEAVKNHLAKLIERQNGEFAFSSELDNLTVFQSQQKTLMISDWIKPDDLSPSEFLNKKHEVVIIHDDIAEYSFYFNVANFDLSKLTFLQFSGAEEVRNSAAELIANYIFYGDEVQSPSKDLQRSKGIELKYQPNHEGLSALLEG